MRTSLGLYLNKRTVFQGTFLKYGKKWGYKGLEVTVLLLDIKLTADSSRVLTDHLWFRFTRGFEQLNLCSGDILEFKARVSMYQKGYSDDSDENPIRFDYHLGNPRNIKKVGAAEKDYSIYNKHNEDLMKQVRDCEIQRKLNLSQRFTQRDSPHEQKPILMESPLKLNQRKLDSFF